MQYDRLPLTKKVKAILLRCRIISLAIYKIPAIYFYVDILNNILFKKKKKLYKTK